MAGESSLTFKAYETLRADMLACRLRPGVALKIAELAEALSVSPGAVREALSRLTSEGLVVAEPQRGFRAAPISGADLRDITHVRCEIEAHCIRSAIRCGDVTWEADIVAALHKLSKTPFHAERDPGRAADEFALAHTDFHDALVRACDSPWFLKLRDILYAQSERYRRLSVPLAKYSRDASKEHRDIAAAVLARKADMAVKLLTKHLQTTTRIILESGAVEQDFGPGVDVQETPPRPMRQARSR